MDERKTVRTSDLAGRTADEDEPLARDEQATDASSGRDEAEAIDEEEERRVSAERPDLAASTGSEPDTPLLSDDDTTRFEQRWQEIQAAFVDEPRQAVEQADMLVADLMQRIAASFSDTRSTLEGEWDRGDDVSTEDLRVALTRYRSFFTRLLSA
jgi:hypothetical protein